MYKKDMKIFPPYMLSFPPLYLCLFIYVEKKRTVNIQCYIIPWKRIYIHIFDLKWFLTTMLSLWIFIICSLTMVYLEVISDIQYYLCITITVFQFTRNCNKTFPTTILTSKVTCNSSVTVTYNKALYAIKCQLHFHIRRKVFYYK